MIENLSKGQNFITECIFTKKLYLYHKKKENVKIDRHFLKPLFFNSMG